MKHILTASLFALSASVFAGSAPHWTYEGKSGPENWGELSDEFATCKTGKFQSPIDIRNAYNATLPPLEMNFHTAAEKLVNNGHTLQVTASDEDEFRLDDQIFTLRQCRGRDTRYRIPPAQIPACAIYAPGSCLGCLAVNRSTGHG